ncbi:hypothetical protein HanIR_Chr06g0297671 [Helianthus annuus]|nr:hypothetical protein HanIR_Chr06g0297671 [Helianthus annuus]
MTCAMRLRSLHRVDMCYAMASAYATQGCAISGPAMYLTTCSWAKIQRRCAKFKVHHIGLMAHVTRACVQVRYTLWVPTSVCLQGVFLLIYHFKFVIPPMWDKVTNLNPFFSSLFVPNIQLQASISHSS